MKSVATMIICIACALLALVLFVVNQSQIKDIQEQRKEEIQTAIEKSTTEEYAGRFQIIEYGVYDIEGFENGMRYVIIEDTQTGILYFSLRGGDIDGFSVLWEHDGSVTYAE